MYPPLLPNETDILLWVNGHHSPFLDAFMFMISNAGAWTPLLCVLLYYLFSKKPWQEAVIFLLCMALCLGLGHLLGNLGAKPFFARFRPTYTPEIKEQLHIVYNYIGHPYGFYSGHSCNFFAGATLLALMVRRTWHSILIYLLVSLVVYSRLYLGVHYLSDTLVGMAVGLGLGFMGHYVQEYLRKHFSPLAHRRSSDVYEADYKLWLGSLIAFLPVLSAFAWQVSDIISRVQ